MQTPGNVSLPALIQQQESQRIINQGNELDNQLKQLQLQKQQQEINSRKVEIIKNSLFNLPTNEREQAIKEIDSLTQNQRGKLLEYLVTLSEDARINGLKFMANITSQQRDTLIEQHLN